MNAGRVGVCCPSAVGSSPESYSYRHGDDALATVHRCLVIPAMSTSSNGWESMTTPPVGATSVAVGFAVRVHSAGVAHGDHSPPELATRTVHDVD